MKGDCPPQELPPAENALVCAATQPILSGRLYFPSPSRPAKATLWYPHPQIARSGAYGAAWERSAPLSGNSLSPDLTSCSAADAQQLLHNSLNDTPGAQGRLRRKSSLGSSLVRK